MTISVAVPLTGPYTGNGVTDTFAYSFPVLTDAEIVVTTADAAGAETIQTLTTHYTVTGAGDAGGGTVVMVTPPSSSETLVVTRSTSLEQLTDLQNRKSVNPDVLEAAFDRLTLITQEFSEVHGRTVKLGVTSASDTATLLANLNTLAAIDTEIAQVAAIDSDVTTVAGISADVTTVAGISADVTTVAGISADVTTVAADGADIGVVAGDTIPIGVVAGDTVPINTVAGDTIPINTVAGDSADIATVAGDTIPIAIVASDTIPIAIVASDSAAINTVAGDSADIATVAADGADIGTVAGISANVTTVAGISANVTTVAGDSADIAILAPISADITALAGASGGTLTGYWDFSATSALKIPVGTTAQQPGTPVEGDIRRNTTDSTWEGYDGSAWAALGSANTGWEYVSELWDFDTDGTVGTIETSTFEDGYEYRLVGRDLERTASTNGVLQLWMYKETDAVYQVTSDPIESDIDSTREIHLDIHIVMPRMLQQAHMAISAHTTAGNTLDGRIQLLEITDTTVQAISKVKLVMLSQTFGSGTVHMMRRLDGIT